MTVTYFVAKYADDPLRMEPKNIGVIAIVDGHFYARFIGESEDDSSLDLRKVRGHVRHSGAYKQWIEYWRYLLAGTQSNETIVNGLQATPRLNYFISESSTMAIDAPAEPREILEYLFHLLVSAFPEQKNEELSLSQRCDEILGQYRLRQNPHFIESPRVPCLLSNTRTEHVQPSYGYVNGAEIYFQRVPLIESRPESSAKEVHNAAWIFERLRSDRQERQTRALVKLTAAAHFPNLLDVLSSVSSSVIDVDNQTQVHEEFSRFVAAH